MPEEQAIRAIVGLGNFGREYAETRHNVGFMAVDALAAEHGVTWARKFSGRHGRLLVGRHDLLVHEPLTYMNLSGDSVQPMCAFYRLPAEAMVVVHDDIDLPFGELRIRDGGGHGGHNGIRSIRQRMGTDRFVRLKVGVGRPGQGEVTDHVLGRFTGDERAALPALITATVRTLWLLIEQGVKVATNETNGRKVV